MLAPSFVQTLECVQRMPELLREVDGVVVQRRALGLNTPAEHTAALQKELLQYCNVHGKTVLLTDVVDSMQVRPPIGYPQTQHFQAPLMLSQLIPSISVRMLSPVQGLVVHLN